METLYVVSVLRGGKKPKHKTMAMVRGNWALRPVLRELLKRYDYLDIWVARQGRPAH